MTTTIPDNWKVCVVICPVCDEPVIADLALSSNEPDPGALIRHHVERRAIDSGRKTLHQYCHGSKQVVPAGHAIDPLTLRRNAATRGPDVRMEFQQGRHVTITER